MMSMGSDGLEESLAKSQVAVSDDYVPDMGGQTEYVCCFVVKLHIHLTFCAVW